MVQIAKCAQPAWEYLKPQNAHMKHFLVSTAALIVVLAFMLGFKLDLQWFWILLFAALTVPFAPWISSPVRYFRGGLNDDNNTKSGFALLTTSTFVSWVFAKSILNASELGAEFGITGGLAYAAYYTSFGAVAFVVYFIRKRGYRSLPEAIYQRYGIVAVWTFAAAVLYRLFQEVWSNSLVVAGFYGTMHSGTWWAAAIASTAVPAFYCITGGMRASLTTDVLQAILKCVFLIIILALVGTRAVTSFGKYNPAGSCALPSSVSVTDTTQCAKLSGNLLNADGSLVYPAKSTFDFVPASCNYTGLATQATCRLVNGTWTPNDCQLTTEPSCQTARGTWTPVSMKSLAGGVDLLIVGLLQGCLSYPFFDPVLTDRAFLAEPKTMVWSFLVGGAFAATFIILFSFFGIFGNMEAVLRPNSVPADLYADMLGGVPPAVAAYLGTAVYSVVNLVFIISSCCVLDSTFSSTSKLFGPEFLGLLQDGRPRPPQLATRRHVRLGRIAIVVIAVCGTLQLMAEPKALNATTQTGTMVIGLGPPVYALTFIKGYRPLLFHLPFWTGLAFGIVYQLSTDTDTESDFVNSGFAFGDGTYNTLLGYNVIGSTCCWGLALLCLLENWWGADLIQDATKRRFWPRGSAMLDRALTFVLGPDTPGEQAIEEQMKGQLSKDMSDSGHAAQAAHV